MKTSKKEMSIYRKNKESLEQVLADICDQAKGRNIDYRKSVMDSEGKFSHEKLNALTENMLDLWAEWRTEITSATDEENPYSIQNYIKERRELYRLYLYVVMRCSLVKGVFGYGSSSKMEEQSNFAFLLKMAKSFSDAWSVLNGIDEQKINVPYGGFPQYFGFHLFPILRDFDDGYTDSDSRWSYADDFATEVNWDPWDITNDGNQKQVYFKTETFSLSEFLERVKAQNSDSEGERDEEFDYDTYELNRLTEEAERKSFLQCVWEGFAYLQEYYDACKAFVELYKAASPAVLKDFYKELEEIVDIYLLETDATMLADTDKTLDLYSQLHDGALQTAKKYARGILLKRL